MALCRLFAALLLSLMMIAGARATPTIEGLEGPAAGAIEREIGRNDFGDYVVARVFYGDLSGQGTRDALAFLTYSTGGNSESLTTWVWRDTGSGYVLAKAPSLDEVYGIEPRNVRFSKGRIEVTTTVPKPGDPRCCPTGQKTFVISVGDGTPHGAGDDLDVPIVEQGGDGQMANCASSKVAGLKPGSMLSVRSGPGTQYRKIAELKAGEVVFVYAVEGSWAGVVYRTSNVTCASTTTRPVPYDNKGWVHTDWLKELAG